MSTKTNETPIISVITAVLNGARHLRQCIESVRSQRSVALEQIIIDGGSIDETQDIMRDHADALAYWHSGPDTGIADAMNKGIAQARGEWLLFLQSDDYLIEPEALVSAFARMEDISDVDIHIFPVQFGEAERAVVQRPRGANTWLRLKTGILHQGAFVRRRVFEDIGGYDQRYRIAMDYEFFLRAYLAGRKFHTHAGPVFAVMRDTGVSSRLDWPSLLRRFAEERAIHLAHSSSLPARAMYTAYWAAYLPYRKLRHALSAGKRS